MEEMSDAQKLRDIEGSWAGGNDGMQVTNKFLELIDVSFSVGDYDSFTNTSPGSPFSPRSSLSHSPEREQHSRNSDPDGEPLQTAEHNRSFS